MTGMPSVLIVDDHRVVAEALTEILGRRYRVVGVATSLDRLGERLRQESPTIVLFDLQMGDRPAIPELRGFARDFPTIRFIVLTAYIDPVLADSALAAGARGYVVKRGSSDELRQAIDLVVAGGTFVSPDARTRGARRARASDRSPTVLSDRQEEVLDLVRRGFHSEEIAHMLTISADTVNHHVANLLKLAGVRNRGQLVRWAEMRMTGE